MGSPLPAAPPRLSIILAIPDHPWTRVARDAAAVRIAMTVAEAGTHPGTHIEITAEAGLDTDNPELSERRTTGRINADLTIGTDVSIVVPLTANVGVCSRGVAVHGSGFIVTPQQAETLGLGTRPGLESHIRPYRNGRDLLQRPRGVMVIDLFGLDEKTVRTRFPEVYQHLYMTVREGRAAQVAKSATADAKAYLATWWIFGKPRTELRPALSGLRRYIGTVETSKHRIFHFLDASILPDNMIVAIGSGEAFHHGVLSSACHVSWSLLQGGTLEDRPRYSKSLVFDPFPFPDATPAQRTAIAALAEELDLTRRLALEENPGLTMTGLYNLVAALRTTSPLAPEAEAAATRARARIVAKLHTDLDTAVAAAYGWPADLPASEIVARLVALNAERAAEESAGHIRWLRPAYQAKS